VAKKGGYDVGVFVLGVLVGHRLEQVANPQCTQANSVTGEGFVWLTGA